MCYGLWSKLPIVSKNKTEVDGHEANTRGLYTDCKGSLLYNGGKTILNTRSFDPGTYVLYVCVKTVYDILTDLEFWPRFLSFC